MPAKIIDLTGKRFGRLIVIEISEERRSNGSCKWLCKCDCGNEKVIVGDYLKRGDVKSCGCLRTEIAKPILEKGSNADSVEDTRTSLLTMAIKSNNTSGVKGVSWNKRNGKWEAYISLKNKRKWLGCFSDKQDAVNARKEAEEKYFKPILEKYGKTQ